MAAPPPLAITIPPLGGAVVGAQFNATLSATGGVSPYTFSIGAGTLAAGLSLNSSTGVISGIPTATAGGPAANITWVVTDSLGTSVSKAAALNVGPPPPLALTVPPLGGHVNQAFNATLTATGGVPPYAFSVSAGTLPAGLSLNSSTGVISGTPTVTVGGPAGNVTFKVTDNVGASVTKAGAFNIGN